MDGIIIKAVSGFYYVYDGEKTVVCKARGRFRHEGITPLVGDRTSVALSEDGTGVLEAIAPRKNKFARPPISNVDQLVIFASEAPPRTDPFLIDRIAGAGAAQGCRCMICINKCDLEAGDRLLKIYSKAGFDTLQISAKTGAGLSALLHMLAGRTSAFTGNSGVGKSSILNALFPGVHLKVGDISEKLGRGRHTTRHVELFPLENDTFVADTPGFSAFDVFDQLPLQKNDVQKLFLEFAPYLNQCRFTGCSHIKEAGCSILEAVTRGNISQSRYQSYVRLYEEASQVKSSYF
ncbi:MAG: ribosome small subunit-dependent GTPase A [Oscillospiraceae bacterium]|nr:ribosome small subunit-dependent GTPase A [Oscillospiraceae bacterium]